MYYGISRSDKASVCGSWVGWGSAPHRVRFYQALDGREGMVGVLGAGGELWAAGPLRAEG